MDLQSPSEFQIIYAAADDILYFREHIVLLDGGEEEGGGQVVKNFSTERVPTEDL